MKTRKHEYMYVLQGCYSEGWEDLSATEYTPSGRKEVYSDLKAYRENEHGQYRVIRRRVKKEGVE